MVVEICYPRDVTLGRVLCYAPNYMAVRSKRTFASCGVGGWKHHAAVSEHRP